MKCRRQCLVQYRRQSLANRGGGKESFKEHMASDKLGKTLATAPLRGPIFFVCGGAGPTGAGVVLCNYRGTWGKCPAMK